MPKWTEYTTKDTLADNDEVMLYDATGRVNKRGLMSKFWDYVVDKMATAVIGKLETENKTVIGAINALNSDTRLTSSGEFFSNKSNIKDVHFVKKNGVITVDAITNEMDIEENVNLCTVVPEYRPPFSIHFIGYSYSQTAFVQLSLNVDGNVKVFGAHTLRGKVYFHLTYIVNA